MAEQTQFNSPWTVANIEAELNGTKAARGNGTMTEALAAKQDKLTVGTNLDATPTENSTNPVTSGGVFSAIAGFITFDDILGQGVAIVSTSQNPGDLNDYKTPGKYYGQNTVTNSLQHLPIANTQTHIGLLVLKITNSNIMQIVKFGGLTQDPYIYFRRYAVGTDTWQSWYVLTATAVSS